jgi:MFS family permease
MAAPEGATARAVAPRRALATVVFVVFLDLVGFGVVVPILPFYVRSFGVSDVFIGLLAASYSLAQFVFAPLLGRVSDARGRRPVLMLSLAGSVVAWTVFGVAGEVLAVAGVVAGVATLFASRTLAGAMGGNIATAQAYVADVTPVERRAAALGLLGASFSVGFVFGPALGGLLASDAAVALARDALPAAVPATRFSLPSFGAAALSLLALVSAALFLPEPARTRSAPARTTLVGGFVAALSDRSLRDLVVSFFLLSLAFSGVQVMFIPFAADVYGYDATQTALFLTYVGALGAVNQGVVVGRLSARYDDARLAAAGSVVLLVSLVVLPFSPALGRLLPPLGGPAWFTRELFVLLVDGALLSFGNGLLTVSLSTLVSTRTGADRQGSAFGVTQGAGSLGRTVGPPVMAALYVVGFPLPFLVGALVLAPVAAVLARSEPEGTATVPAD